MGSAEARPVGGSRRRGGTRDYLERIRDTGLRPLVSISDRTLPVWLHDPRCHSDLATCADAGWLDGERAVREAALFAGWRR